MEITVVLDTAGAATAGIDRDALIADIQAELNKLTSKVGTEPAKPVSKAAPSGAQGDLSIIQWLIDVATDPEMAKVYARALIFAVNEILAAAKSKERSDDESSGEASTPETDEDKSSVRINVLGKAIALPAATSAIKAFLDQLGDD